MGKPCENPGIFWPVFSLYGCNVAQWSKALTEPCKFAFNLFCH